MKVIMGLKDSVRMASAQGVKIDMPIARRANKSALIVGWLGFICLCMLWCASCAHASEPVYTDEQIVNAIKLSEGKNSKGWYSYGIKSVRCETEKECRNICYRTVSNNRRRYKNYGYKRFNTFEGFLASRYCPVSGKNLSNDEKRLNQYWLSNVNWFLKHPKEG